MPLRQSVGALIAGRTERAHRANVVDSILIAIDVSGVDNVDVDVGSQLLNTPKCSKLNRR